MDINFYVAVCRLIRFAIHKLTDRSSKIVQRKIKILSLSSVCTKYFYFSICQVSSRHLQRSITQRSEMISLQCRLLQRKFISCDKSEGKFRKKLDISQRSIRALRSCNFFSQNSRAVQKRYCLLYFVFRSSRVLRSLSQ